MIVGPCSLHDLEATLDYAEKLKRLSQEVEESFQIVMRAYFEKPRTNLGWRGLLHDPNLDGSYDIEKGIRMTRSCLKHLTELQIPLATEFLDPISPLYFGDYISWGCIGARTVSSPLHRQIASHLPMPVGFKNTTEGNIDIALEAIGVAKQPQTFISLSDKGALVAVASKGNSNGHLVLRGGKNTPNYTHHSIQIALQKTPYLLVDCSHDNSQKDPHKQLVVFNDVIDQIANGEKRIRGLMLESFLYTGNQSLSPPLKYGVSLTDSCLDFTSIEHLIRKSAELLQPCAILS